MNILCMLNVIHTQNFFFNFSLNKLIFLLVIMRVIMSTNINKNLYVYMFTAVL